MKPIKELAIQHAEDLLEYLQNETNQEVFALSLEMLIDLSYETYLIKSGQKNIDDE
jgi:hypothetical protein